MNEVTLEQKIESLENRIGKLEALLEGFTVAPFRVTAFGTPYHTLLKL